MQTENENASPLRAITDTASKVWMIGMAAMVIYAVVNYILLRKRVAEGLPEDYFGDNMLFVVYVGENPSKNCVISEIKPVANDEIWIDIEYDGSESAEMSSLILVAEVKGNYDVSGREIELHINPAG